MSGRAELVPDMERRAFLGLVIASLPFHLFPKLPRTALTTIGGLTVARQDLHTNPRAIPTGSSEFKLSTQGFEGGLFVMEHNSQQKGGPPRHLHHNEDEWFYVLEGEYLVEVGSQRYRLGSGDSILGPRKVPHTWAFVGNMPGWLLRTYAPAGKMTAFFSEHKKRGEDTQYSVDPALYRAWGMELLGPPLLID